MRKLIVAVTFIAMVMWSFSVVSATDGPKARFEGEPVQAFVTVKVVDGSIYGGENFFTVPYGKILIIEQVEVESSGLMPASGQKILAGITTEVGTVLYGHNITLLTESLSDLEQHAMRLVRLYADPETTVRAFFNRRPTTGTYSLMFVMTGRLLDVP